MESYEHNIVRPKKEPQRKSSTKHFAHQIQSREDLLDETIFQEPLLDCFELLVPENNDLAISKAEKDREASLKHVQELRLTLLTDKDAFLKQLNLTQQRISSCVEQGKEKFFTQWAEQDIDENYNCLVKSPSKSVQGSFSFGRASSYHQQKSEDFSLQSQYSKDSAHSYNSQDMSKMLCKINSDSLLKDMQQKPAPKVQKQSSFTRRHNSQEICSISEFFRK